MVPINMVHYYTNVSYWALYSGPGVGSQVISNTCSTESANLVNIHSTAYHIINLHVNHGQNFIPTLTLNTLSTHYFLCPYSSSRFKIVLFHITILLNNISIAIPKNFSKPIINYHKKRQNIIITYSRKTIRKKYYFLYTICYLNSTIRTTKNTIFYTINTYWKNPYKIRRNIILLYIKMAFN